MCHSQRKFFNVKTILAISPSSVSDNLRGSIVPSWAQKCHCNVIDQEDDAKTGLTLKLSVELANYLPHIST